MGSSRLNSEITEAAYDPSTTRCPPTFRPQDREQKPPLQRKPHGKYLEDDINKLFESINLRSSKSLDLSDWPRNPSKKPIRALGPHSPAIGFSEPVSLKQALRGMCISQAAEMAAAKRLSMPASPRVSETGKLSNLCGPKPGNFVRANEDLVSCSSLGYDSKSGGKSLKCGSGVEREYVMCSQELNQSSRSLQSGVVINEKKTMNDCNDTTGHNSEVDKSSSNDVLKLGEKVSSLNKVNGPTKVANKVAPKVRMKPKLQIVPSSNTLKSNKDVKSTRRTSPTAKPVVKNKALIVNKPKKVKISTIRSLETPHGGKNESRGQNPTVLICQNCQCSMEKTNNELIKDPPITDTTSKSVEKVDFSQSSKSSNCDFSSSTTSLSEDSCLNGSTFGNRPHMSKDKKWESINRIRLQYGFLGLNHFNLLRKLGSGDIGTVYLSELIGTNCVFAIKVMDNEFLAVRKKTGRAQTEREILRMLDHPFLPVLYAQFTSDNLSCLVLEFCSGGDLHVLRQKQPGRYFHEQAARFYVAEVLLALEYLHMLGIVYRDLKPENILVRQDGHIMLTDFDLSLRCSVNPTLVKSSGLPLDPARISGPCAGSNCIDPFCAGPSCQVSCFGPALHSTAARARARKLKADAAARARDRALPQLVAEPNNARSNSFVGTHEYLAPEIIKGDGHGSAVDWWTFGVLLYELLYGRTPFKGACNEETVANVVLKGLRFPESPMVSSQARDLIRGLLVKYPENRIGTETGAAEIKKHPFFDGLNWALIRCGPPPRLPEVSDGGGELEKGKGHMGCGGGNGGDSEFELF